MSLFLDWVLSIVLSLSSPILSSTLRILFGGHPLKVFKKISIIAFLQFKILHLVLFISFFVGVKICKIFLFFKLVSNMFVLLNETMYFTLHFTLAVLKSS